MNERAELTDDLLRRLQELNRCGGRLVDTEVRVNELVQLARRLDLTDELIRRGAPIEP